MELIIFCLVVSVIYVVGRELWLAKESSDFKKRFKAMSSEEKGEWISGAEERLHGKINKPLICPHCQTKGFVRVTTSGITQCFSCTNCSTNWDNGKRDGASGANARPQSKAGVGIVVPFE